MKKHKELTEGSIVKAIFKIFVPVAIANLLQTAYNMTDTFWVGKLGAKAIASVSLSFPVLFLLFSFVNGFTLAGSILVSQYKGGKNQRMINYISAQTITFSLLASLLISIVGYLLAPNLMQAFTSDPYILKNSIEYLQTIFLGTVFVFTFTAFNSLMRGVGSPKTATRIYLISVLLNLILDPLFINGCCIFPALGVKGAALATIFTQSLASFIALFFLCRKKGPIQLHFKDLKPDFNQMKRLIKIGYPASLEQIMRSFGGMALIFLVSKFGADVIAAYGIAMRLFGFVIIPSFAFFVATSTLVGQNIGAGKKERAKETAKQSMILAFLVLTIEGVLTFVFAEQIIRFFVNDQNVISIGKTFVRLLSFTFGFLGIQLVIEGAANGSGNTKLAMIFAFVSLFFVRLPLAYILSLGLKLKEFGVWLSFLIEIVSLSFVYLYIYEKRKDVWFSRKLTEEDVLESKTVEAVETIDSEKD